MITVFRILCVPVFINLLIYNRSGYALILFLVAVITDGLDNVTTVLQFGYIVVMLAVVSLAWGMEIAEPAAVTVAAVTIGSGLHSMWRGTRAVRAEPAVG